MASRGTSGSTRRTLTSTAIGAPSGGRTNPEEDRFRSRCWTRAAAKFITSHKNIFFQYNQHADQTARNYTARPGLHHPYDWMAPEDNEFYTRIGAVWSALGGGNIIENNYYSQEIAAGAYTLVQHGCEVDWAYISRGLHALMPEGMAVGKDYDGDRYVNMYEILRWNDEEKAGELWPQWTSFDHPTLGAVEIGGWRGMPPALDERMLAEADLHYRFLLYIADLAPILKIAKLTAETVADGEYRVVDAAESGVLGDLRESQSIGDSPRQPDSGPRRGGGRRSRGRRAAAERRTHPREAFLSVALGRRRRRIDENRRVARSSRLGHRDYRRGTRRAGRA